MTSGALATALATSLGITAAAARKRIERRVAPVRTVNLTLPRGAQFLYLESQYGSPKFWDEAIKLRIPERVEWAHQHGYQVLKANWLGMYAPDVGSRLYLVGRDTRGLDLSKHLEVHRWPPRILPNRQLGWCFIRDSRVGHKGRTDEYSVRADRS